MVLIGGVVFCTAQLSRQSPYPYFGKKAGEYVLETLPEEAIPLQENETLEISGQMFCFLPGRVNDLAQKKSTVFVREYRELGTIPEMIILAPDAPWRSAVRWEEYATRRGVPLYDMRAKGWYKFVSE